MKKIFNILCVAAAIVALASCAKENFVKKIGTEKTFQAGFDITKTNVDAAYKTTWAEGDVLKIINQYDGNEIIEIPEASFGSATTAITTTVEDADYYYAVYGDEGAYYDGYNLAIHIDEIQGGTWGDAQKAVAVAIENAFNLKNISSIIEFNVSEDVCSVEFVSRDEGFSTEAYVTFSEEGEPVCETQSTAETISIETSFNAGTFYACVLPTELSELTINISDGDEIKSIHIDTPISLTAGKVLKLGNIESRAGKTYKVVGRETLDALSGNLDTDGAFTFAANQGSAGTAPALQADGSIRLYQGNPGGNIQIKSVNGDKIKGVKVKTTSTYNAHVVLKEDSEPYNVNDTVFIKYGSTKTFSGLDAQTVTLYTYGTSKTERFEPISIYVTYEVDARTPQTLSFPQASYTVPLSGPFSAPTVSGAQTTVTYSSSDPTVATVNATTGAVSLVGLGKAVITATAEENDTYKAGVASYELNVANILSGIAGIKASIIEGGTTVSSFDAQVQDMLVTYVKLDAYPFVAYAQDANGDAIHIFGNNATDVPLAVGDKISGLISGKGKVYNGTAEITTLSIDASAIKTTGCAVSPEVVTLATLEANYADYEYHMIKVADATIATAFGSAEGSISQSGTTVAIKGGSKSTISTYPGAVADIICFPQYNNDAHQLTLWEQSQVTVTGGVNYITITNSKSIKVDENWTLDGTCLSGSVSYSITEGSDVISLNAGIITALKAGTAKVKATSPAEGIYTAGEAICTITVSSSGTVVYEKFTGTLAEGDYLIIADSVAMNTTVSSDRIQYDNVTITSNTVSNPDSTLIWHIAKSGDYWTIYNVKEAKYLASTGAKNKAGFQTSGTDDKSLWSYTSGAWVNKKNTANKVNATLRRNDAYGFACYGASTGSAPVLYKKK